MNVLLLVNTAHGYGGILSFAASLSEGLRRRNDVSVSIALSEHPDVDRYLRVGGVNLEILDFGEKNILGIIKNYRRLSRIIKKCDIQVIHALNRIPALYAAVYCFFHRKTNYIWSNHLVPIQWDTFHRILTRYGKCAVAEGMAGKRMLREKFHIPEDKIEVINLGTDISSFTRTSIENQTALRKEHLIWDNEKVILLYGRFAPMKGHLFLLKALSRLKNYQYRVIFPGNPETKEYGKSVFDYAKESGIYDRLITPGFIKGRDYLSISDLMVLPSEMEGFGIVNVESFCCEVPVIRTKTGGYEDMADCCFGIEYGNVDELTGLLESFFEGDDMFAEKAAYAKSQVKARFSLEAMTNHYYSLYERVSNYEKI